MTRLLIAAMFLPSLAACGIDGAPIPPSEVEEEDRTPVANQGGITISGNAEIGVAGSF